ncbi:MAG: MFS transporter [Polyangiaceae bacterium]|nr:MFS transporter [Polyangiaceae bacterium]
MAREAGPPGTTALDPAAPGRAVFLWFAAWAGVCVACIYLCQPLLHAIGADLGLSDREASFIATSIQMGYGVGIFVLVPLGDFLPRRTLVLVKTALLALATFACALSPTLGPLAAASFFVGVFATSAQDLVPVAADLAPAAQRGRYVGRVMSGLILGILLSRTLAGWVAGAFGWRAVFVVGTGAVAASLATMLRFFPALSRGVARGSIASVYSSMAGLLREHPALRVTVLRHGLMAFSFSAFWSNLAFYLSGPPHHWTPPQIGLMGLAGAAGVLGSTIAGRLADERGPLFTIRIATLVASGAFLAMGALGSRPIALVAGTVLFDVAVQASLVSHQSLVYGLDPNARARLNGIFVSSLFLFFSLGSFLGAIVWSHWGWFALMGVAVVACALSFALSFVKGRGGAGAPSPAQPGR